MPVTITRTYEKFAVRWADGSRESPFVSVAEAETVIGNSPRKGTVERDTFDVTFSEDRAHLYNPGIAETRSES